MGEDEFELLRKFKDIIRVSREVKKVEIAKYLGITEELLFEKLIKWGQDIPFKIKLDSIEIDNMDAFIGALDKQFGAWENREKSGIDKFHNKTPENAVKESSVLISEISSAQPSTNTKLQDKFEFLMDYAENSMNSHRYDEAIKYFEKATAIAEDLLEGDLIRKTEKLIKKAGIRKKKYVKCEKLTSDARNLMECYEWDEAIVIWDKITEISSVYGWEDRIKTSREEIKKCDIEKTTPRSYRGTLLVSQEYYFMMELDNLIGEIPVLSEMKYNTFGFRALDNHIVQLNLYNKKLTSLPESIGNLKSLETLRLHNNKISSLPESIGNLTSLTRLYLFDNQMSSLPESIGNLTSLIELNLYNNQMSSLPESIRNLPSLKELNLGYNPSLLLLPSLPERIKKLIKQLKKNGCKVYQ